MGIFSVENKKAQLKVDYITCPCEESPSRFSSCCFSSPVLRSSAVKVEEYRGKES